MITNTALFKCIDKEISFTSNRYRHVDFVWNDIDLIKSKVYVKIWRQRKTFRPSGWKAYIKVAVKNTFTNYFEEFYLNQYRKLKVPLITKIQDDEKIEYFPDVIDARQENLDIDWEDYKKRLDETQIKYLDLMIDGLTKQQIARELKVTKRQVDRVKLIIKKDFKEYLNLQHP